MGAGEPPRFEWRVGCCRRAADDDAADNGEPVGDASCGAVSDATSVSMGSSSAAAAPAAAAPPPAFRGEVRLLLPRDLPFLPLLDAAVVAADGEDDEDGSPGAADGVVDAAGPANAAITIGGGGGGIASLTRRTGPLGLVTHRLYLLNLNLARRPCATSKPTSPGVST